MGAHVGVRSRLSRGREPTGFAVVIAPAMAAAVRQANRKDLARLAEVLQPPPRWLA